MFVHSGCCYLWIIKMWTFWHWRPRCRTAWARAWYTHGDTCYFFGHVTLFRCIVMLIKLPDTHKSPVIVADWAPLDRQKYTQHTDFFFMFSSFFFVETITENSNLETMHKLNVCALCVRAILLVRVVHRPFASVWCARSYAHVRRCVRANAERNITGAA